MSEQDKNITLESPVRLLLNSLPASVYQEKWKAIKTELHATEEFEHFRQSVTRTGFDLGRTHGRVIDILMRHLGLSFKFFILPANDRDNRMDEIAKVVQQFTPMLKRVNANSAKKKDDRLPLSFD